MSLWTDDKGQKHHDMGTCYCGAHHALEGQQRIAAENRALRDEVARLRKALEKKARKRGAA